MNLKPFIITKPLIILFTILTVLFPWHYIRISGIIYTNSDLFFFIFGYILLASVCLNFLLIVKRGRIYKTLGIVGYYTSIINFFGYITYFFIIMSLNKFKIVQFSFDFGFYFFISFIVIVTVEFFLKDTQSKKQSIQNAILQEERSTVKVGKEQKLKSNKVKKGFKSLSKTVGKIAVETVGDHIAEATGDLIGDQLTEITGNSDLGQLIGKFAEKGLSTLSEKAVDKASEKLSQFASNQELSLGQIDSETLNRIKTQQIESLKIDYKNALLGILKTKQHVQIEYIQNILKLTHEHILGIIYELVGEGKIEGVFNLDDTEFTIKI